jgi:Tfp pilus assembly protein PilN
MAQQINLCAPILLTQKKYFSAHTMAASLGIFVLVGGVLAGAWSWNLRSAAAQYTATMESQSRDMVNLQAALERNKAAAQPVDAGLTRQLEQRKQQLEQRKALLAALQDGATEPGNAYSDRLKFLAASTPPQVWITGVAMASGTFHVSGYTLEPSALNAWVAHMATHPLLQGLQLSDVQVKAATPARPAVAAVAGAPAVPAPTTAQRMVWSFDLASTRPLLTNATEPEPKP